LGVVTSSCSSAFVLLPLLCVLKCTRHCR
jgi:hypothetical protein